jgi:hypothetical protein
LEWSDQLDYKAAGKVLHQSKRSLIGEQFAFKAMIESIQC